MPVVPVGMAVPVNVVVVPQLVIFGAVAVALTILLFVTATVPAAVQAAFVLSAIVQVNVIV